jgi:hypothetical protein
MPSGLGAHTTPMRHANKKVWGHDLASLTCWLISGNEHSAEACIDAVSCALSRPCLSQFGSAFSSLKHNLLMTLQLFARWQVQNFSVWPEPHRGAARRVAACRTARSPSPILGTRPCSLELTSCTMLPGRLQSRNLIRERICSCARHGDILKYAVSSPCLSCSTMTLCASNKRGLAHDSPFQGDQQHLSLRYDLASSLATL